MNILEFLYATKTGRILLLPLTSEPVSRMSGVLLDSHFSKLLIGPFARKNHIHCEDYLLEGIESFNDFFCRKIRPELRPVDESPNHLPAPCDGLLSVYPITDDLVIPVKQSAYHISDLLRNKKAADYFNGGYCYVFRLCVGHYHRYIYPLSGYKSNNVHIKGLYHTVRPVALRGRKVFCENTREYTLLKSAGKTILQMEVGAMLVGRITNNDRAACMVKRGQEKGYFEYGGSIFKASEGMQFIR